MTKPWYNIRLFHPQDQSAVKQLILNGLAEHFDTLDPAYNPDLDDITRHYSPSGGTFILAETMGKIIGTGALVIEPAGAARLVRLSVHQDYRRRGLGQALVDYLIARVKESGYQRLLVETNLDWFAAIRLYRRCGFTEYKRDEECVHMELRFPPKNEKISISGLW